MSVDTKNISFKKLTKQSIRNIHERILNEKTRHDIEKTENAELSSSQKQRKSFKKRKKEEDIYKEPNKDFIVGNSLPRRYQLLFPEKLYGAVIEEVDPYWKNSYVKYFLLNWLTREKF